MRNALGDRAEEMFGAKKAYVLIKIRKDEKDEEICEEVVIDGETYFKTEDGTLYDPDSQEVVGLNGKLFE